MFTTPNLAYSCFPEFLVQRNNDFNASEKFRQLYSKRVIDNEVKTTQKVNSNYAPVYDYIDSKLVYSYAECDLSELDDVNQTSLGIIMTQMIYALYDVHKSGIVHKDIKPENFLLYQDGAKIIDFGSAKEGTKTTEETKNKEGTSFYKAPEVYDLSYSSSRDIYSLGLTFYFLETGEAPYHNIESNEIIERKKNGDPLSFPISTNLEMKYMISFMTRPDPKLRPSTNLLMLIAHQKVFLPSLAHPQVIPEYKPCKENGSNGNPEPNLKKKIMKYEWIVELCKDLFSNTNMFSYMSAKEIRKDLQKRINDLSSQLKKKDINLDDDTIRKQYLTMELIKEIKNRLTDEPIVASLFYQKCYQKSVSSNCTIIQESVFTAENEKNDNDEIKKKKKEKFVLPQCVSNGNIALDYTDYMIESFEHFVNGNINAFTQSMLSKLKEILDSSEGVIKKDDIQELDYILGNTTQNTVQDYTSIFKKSIGKSPMTSTSLACYSEEAILKFYQILYEDDNFLTVEMAENGSQMPHNEPLYALYPTLMFYPADPFMSIAHDPVDRIYYTNWMITSALSGTQSTNYLTFRLLFMMQELTQGIHVKQDLALASEFAELIPDECFQIEDIFVAERIITFMKYLYYSEGAAVDNYKLYRYQKLLNTDQKELVEQEEQDPNNPKPEGQEKKPEPRGKWLIDAIHNIMYSQIEETSYNFIFLYKYDI